MLYLQEMSSWTSLDWSRFIIKSLLWSRVVPLLAKTPSLMVSILLIFPKIMQKINQKKQQLRELQTKVVGKPDVNCPTANAFGDALSILQFFVDCSKINRTKSEINEEKVILHFTTDQKSEKVILHHEIVSHNGPPRSRKHQRSQLLSRKRHTQTNQATEGREQSDPELPTLRCSI